MNRPTRPDDPRGVMMHKDRYLGGKALIVLGGESGKKWEQVRAAIEPDVILTANGATHLPAEYWMLTENMMFSYARAKAGEKRYQEYMQLLMDPQNQATFKLLSHRSWRLLDWMGIDPQGYICIRRWLYDDLCDFSLRDYGEGYIKGPISQSKGWNPKVKVCVGTVGLQLLHQAGILGVREVHTVGFDLMARGHWYTYPEYKADKFRNENMFVTYKGAQTQEWWIETVHFLKTLQAHFEQAGLDWVDHSGGLLKVEGLWCAV